MSLSTKFDNGEFIDCLDAVLNASYKRIDIKDDQQHQLIFRKYTVVIHNEEQKDDFDKCTIMNIHNKRMTFIYYKDDINNKNKPVKYVSGVILRSNMTTIDIINMIKDLKYLTRN